MDPPLDLNIDLIRTYGHPLAGSPRHGLLDQVGDLGSSNDRISQLGDDLRLQAEALIPRERDAE